MRTLPTICWNSRFRENDTPLSSPVTTPNERWPRFTLRTMFVVVTVVGIALGLAWTNWRVRERERWQEELPARGALLGKVISESPSKQVPFLWAIFGARPIGLIVLPDSALTDDELTELARLFPEATIKRGNYRLDMPRAMGR
jgi:hypothetical protein